jgi:hypothetical protein
MTPQRHRPSTDHHQVDIEGPKQTLPREDTLVNKMHECRASTQSDPPIDSALQAPDGDRVENQIPKIPRKESKTVSQ